MMFSFNYLVVTFALLAGLVASAPIAADLSDEAELVMRAPPSRGGGGMAKAVSVANQIRTKIRPKPNQAVFWSGTKTSQGKTVSVKQDAQKFARKNGKETLNMALKKNGINIPSQKANPQSNRLWDIASKAWATRASGKTDAVLGGSVRPDSVWKRVEKPELMKNNKVTQVTEHNRQTGTSTITKRK